MSRVGGPRPSVRGDAPDLTGWLHKRGENNPAFKARYFVLTGRTLRYGRTMGFTEVTIRQLPDSVREAVARESSPPGIGALMLDAPVVAIGRHTKVFPSK